MEQNIGDKYNDKTANNNLSRDVRDTSEMFWIKSFNNWIKAVLINKYCSLRTNEVRKILDLRTNTNQKTLHVLDIGCGHGQDISKWKNNPVGYIVGIDVSDEALKTYIERWNGSSCDYDFTPVHMSASVPQLYQKISHSNYDIVSAQLSLHYMFGSEQEVRKMLTNVLQNLLEGGYMILTIPDSCSIVKKMRQFAKKEGEYYVHGNKYFSMRFKSLDFDKQNGSFGLQYGFYLKDAIGSEISETKDQQGNIKTQSSSKYQYWNQYLIELNAFERILKQYDMQVIQNKNFLEFYKENYNEYRPLFSRMKLNFRKDESIHEDFWEIAHLYRVFVARKIRGKNFYSLASRNQDRKKVSQIKSNNQRNSYHHSNSNHKDRRYGGGGSGGRGGHHNNYNNNHSRGRNDGGYGHSQSKRNYH